MSELNRSHGEAMRVEARGILQDPNHIGMQLLPYVNENCNLVRLYHHSEQAVLVKRQISHKLSRVLPTPSPLYRDSTTSIAI